MTTQENQGVQIPSREQIHQALEEKAMEPALFHNFSDSEFIGYWAGKARKYKAGEKKFLPTYLAQHFATYLANRELLKLGKETSTSPKNVDQVPEFAALYHKAFIPQEQTADSSDRGMDVVDSQIALMNEPSMNIPGRPAKVEEAQSSELQTPIDDDDDESGFEDLKPEVKPAA